MANWIISSAFLGGSTFELLVKTDPAIPDDDLDSSVVGVRPLLLTIRFSTNDDCSVELFTDLFELFIELSVMLFGSINTSVDSKVNGFITDWVVVDGGGAGGRVLFNIDLGALGHDFLWTRGLSGLFFILIFNAKVKASAVAIFLPAHLPDDEILKAKTISFGRLLDGAPIALQKKSRSSTHRDITAAASGSSYRPCLEFLIICVLCFFLSLQAIS